MQLDPGLLAAIIANPDDDLPRLQMADWLDERGECERAEFIRLQVELVAIQKKAPTVGPPASNEWIPTASRRVRKITTRERELLGHPNCEEWTRQVFPNPNGGFYLYGVQGTTIINHLAMRFQFTRGFVSAITCTAHDWLRHADAITAATPLERVTLTTWPEWDYLDSDQQIAYVDWPGWQKDIDTDEMPDGTLIPLWFLKDRWPAIEFTLPPLRPGTHVATLAGRDVRAGDMLYANDDGTVRAV